MMHSIKVSDETYRKLRRLQGPRESYSKVVDRLLAIVEPLQEVKELIGPAHYLAERPKEEVKVHDLS